MTAERQMTEYSAIAFNELIRQVIEAGQKDLSVLTNIMERKNTSHSLFAPQANGPENQIKQILEKLLNDLGIVQSRIEDSMKLDPHSSISVET